MKNVFSTIALVLSAIFATSVFMIGFLCLMTDTITPFFNDLSSEKRLEKFIEKKCIDGNEVAIAIKRSGYYSCHKDQELIRAAIDGNEHAIRALRIVVEKEE